MATDESFHALGVPDNPEVFANPLRHIVFRRFFSTLGVGGYARLRTDVGRYAITKEPRDRGRFRTPSLREVGTQAAFMHNGAFTSLAQVVDFYDRAAGPGELRPLGLSADDKAALVAFLQTFTGRAPAVEAPTPPAYEPRPLGRAGEAGGAP
jgi:cytochrome c peroxidase